MPETSTFGRRQPKMARRAAAPTSPTSDPSELSAAAEAFRAALAADRKTSANDFAAWRRSRRWRQLLVLGATVVSFAPGVASFVMDAPLAVSLALSAAAMAANVWLRRERFRRRRDILAWAPAGDES